MNFLAAKLDQHLRDRLPPAGALPCCAGIAVAPQRGYAEEDARPRAPVESRGHNLGILAVAATMVVASPVACQAPPIGLPGDEAPPPNILPVMGNETAAV